MKHFMSSLKSANPEKKRNTNLIEAVFQYERQLQFFELNNNHFCYEESQASSPYS